MYVYRIVDADGKPCDGGGVPNDNATYTNMFRCDRQIRQLNREDWPRFDHDGRRPFRRQDGVVTWS